MEQRDHSRIGVHGEWGKASESVEYFRETARIGSRKILVSVDEGNS